MRACVRDPFGLDPFGLDPFGLYQMQTASDCEIQLAQNNLWYQVWYATMYVTTTIQNTYDLDVRPILEQ